MGGGLGNFLARGSALPGYTNKTGYRTDNRDLVQEWIEKMKQQKKKAKFLQNAHDLRNLDPQDTDAVLGSFTNRGEIKNDLGLNEIVIMTKIQPQIISYKKSSKTSFKTL